jgi:hypothetical protein
MAGVEEGVGFFCKNAIRGACLQNVPAIYVVIEGLYSSLLQLNVMNSRQKFETMNNCIFIDCFLFIYTCTHIRWRRKGVRSRTSQGPMSVSIHQRSKTVERRLSLQLDIS